MKLFSIFTFALLLMLGLPHNTHASGDVPKCTEYTIGATGNFPSTPLDITTYTSHYSMQVIVTFGTVDFQWDMSLARNGSSPKHLVTVTGFTKDSGTDLNGQEVYNLDGSPYMSEFLKVNTCTGPCAAKVRFCASQY